MTYAEAISIRKRWKNTMKKYDPVIEYVAAGSIAEECGIVPGERLLAVNGVPLRDVIDYQYLTADEELALSVCDANGKTRSVTLSKDEDEDLGIGFQSAVFDGIHKCKNRCVFCFVDQMIRGQRPSLYVKDDDYRLSFLYGNYITLTNLSDEELRRIREQRLSPLFVSVHCVDEDLRKSLLGIKKERPFLPLLKSLSEDGIDLHGQVVLVPGMNDGAYLRETIEKIAAISGFRSLALVPVGLTKNQNPALRPYNKEQAKEILETVNEYQQRFLKERDTRFVFASDEFYLIAEAEIPPEEAYEDYPQIENGVGLIRSFREDFFFAEEELEPFPRETAATVITGIDGEKALRPIAESLAAEKNLRLELVAVRNAFFGDTVTVTGLLTAGDIIKALEEKEGAKGVCFLPDVLLKHNTDLLLDDISVAEIAEKTGYEIRVTETTGAALAEAFGEWREELI